MTVAKNVVSRLWKATFIVGYGKTMYKVFQAESLVSATYIAEEFAKDREIDLISVVEVENEPK